MSTMTFDSCKSTLSHLRNRLTKLEKEQKHDDFGLFRCLGPAVLAGVGIWAFIFYIVT